MQVPALASLNPILPAVRPVEASVGWQRDGACRLGRKVAARDRHQTGPEGPQDPARTRRTRSHQEPRRAGQAGQGEDSVRDSQAQAGEVSKTPEPGETRPETARAASEPAQTGQGEAVAHAVSSVSGALLPAAATPQTNAEDGAASQEPTQGGGAQVSFAAKMAVKMASFTAVSAPGAAGPEGRATDETGTPQAAETGKGTSSARVPAWVLAAVPGDQGGADGAEPRPGLGSSQAEAGGGESASGRGQEPILSAFLQGQDADGQAPQRDGEGAAQPDAPPKAAAGKAALPALEQGDRAPASRPAAAVADGGASAAKHAFLQAAEAVKGATGMAPAETSNSQVGSPTAAARSSAPAQGQARAGQTLGEAADQVAESIRAAGGRTGRQIIVHLHPPELGRVRIALRTEGESVRGVVRVDVPETLAKLQQEAAPLMHRLQAEGIDLRRLDVMLNQDQAGGQAGHDAAFRQGQNDPDAWFPDAAGETFGSAEGGAAPAAPAETDGQDDQAVSAGRVGGSINVQV